MPFALEAEVVMAAKPEPTQVKNERTAYARMAGCFGNEEGEWKIHVFSIVSDLYTALSTGSDSEHARSTRCGIATAESCDRHEFIRLTL